MGVWSRGSSSLDDSREFSLEGERELAVGWDKVMGKALSDEVSTVFLYLSKLRLLADRHQHQCPLQDADILAPTTQHLSRHHICQEDLVWIYFL